MIGASLAKIRLRQKLGVIAGVPASGGALCRKRFSWPPRYIETNYIPKPLQNFKLVVSITDY
jgi:hypothetical protein